MSDKKAPKVSNPMGLDLDPTYNGKCKATTAKGESCGHRVVFENGLCRQHGGRTSPEYQKRILERSQERFARRKARLERKVEKWLARPSKTLRKAADCATRSTSSGNLAAPAMSNEPRKAACSAASTVEPQQARQPKPVVSWLSAISQGQFQPQAGSAPLAISGSAQQKLENSQENSPPNLSINEPPLDAAVDKPGTQTKPADASEAAAQGAKLIHARALGNDQTTRADQWFNDPATVPGLDWQREYRRRRGASGPAYWQELEARPCTEREPKPHDD